MSNGHNGMVPAILAPFVFPEIPLVVTPGFAAVMRERFPSVPIVVNRPLESTAIRFVVDRPKP